MSEEELIIAVYFLADEGDVKLRSRGPKPSLTDVDSLSMSKKVNETNFPFYTNVLYVCTS